MCSADDTRNSPGASTLSSFTTPSSAYSAKRLARRAHAVGAGVQFQAERAGEVAVAVGQHHQAVGHVLALAPGLHHERVVDRHARHLDALAAELVEVLHEAGQVLFRAGRRERTGHREQHDLAAVEQGVGVDGLDAFADALQGDFGNAIADLDGHGGSPVGMGSILAALGKCRVKVT